MENDAAALLGVFLAISLTSFLASQGGRDQMLVASLSHRLGAGPGLVLASVVAVCVSTAAWGWLGVQASTIVGEDRRSALVVIAIIVAAILLVAPSRLTLPKEPTRSIGAITLVLIMRQLFDAPRLLIFASLTYSGNNIALIVAASLGSLCALVMAMAKGADLLRWTHWRALRIALALMLLPPVLLAILTD